MAARQAACWRGIPLVTWTGPMVGGPVLVVPPGGAVVLAGEMAAYQAACWIGVPPVTGTGAVDGGPLLVPGME